MQLCLEAVCVHKIQLHMAHPLVEQYEYDLAGPSVIKLSTCFIPSGLIKAKTFLGWQGLGTGKSMTEDLKVHEDPTIMSTGACIL